MEICKFSQTHSQSVEVNADSRAFAPGLLYCGCPSAVILGVRPVEVNPVDRRTRRPRTHVMKKIFKLIPSWVHIDSATTISVELNVPAVGTALLHSDPRYVRASMNFVSRNRSPRGECVFLSAPAANAFPAAKRNPKNISFRTAITAAPKSDNLFSGCSFKNRPTTKPFPNKIKFFHYAHQKNGHHCYITMDCHLRDLVPDTANCTNKFPVDLGVSPK